MRPILSIIFAVPFYLFNMQIVGYGYIQNEIPSVKEVKLSGDYHWGEGYATEREAAIDIARQDLAKRMVVTIVSDQSSTERETNQEYSSDYRSNVQMMSRLEVRGLNNIPWQKRDKSWGAIAYISKEDHIKNLEVQAEQIYSKLDQVLTMEKEEKSLSAESFSLYNTIYLSTLFYPEVLFSEPERHGQRTDVRRWAMNKIEEDLKNLTITVSETSNYSTDHQVEIYAKLDVRRNGIPVDDIVLRLDREGYGWHRIQDGSGELYYDRLLDKRVEDISVKIAFDPESIADPTLKGIPSNLLPSINRVVSIDFTDVITLSMNVVSLGQRRLLFHPVFKNLSVFDITWEIDGEEVSRDMPLDYTFEAETESVVVTFRLNREDELTLSKRVWPDGRVEEVGDESISTNESTSISDLQSNAITERVEDLNTLLTKLLSELELLESNETPITNEEVTNEEVTNDEVTNEEVTNEEVTNEEVTNEEVTNEETLSLPSSSTSSTDLKISSTSSNSNNSLVRHNFVPSSHDRIIRGFQTKTRLSSLIEHLKDLQNGRFLQFGNREHVQNDSVSYMIIVDLSYDRVVTILSPEKNSKRYDLQKGETIEIEAIRDTFKGYAPVYVQFLRY